MFLDGGCVHLKRVLHDNVSRPEAASAPFGDYCPRKQKLAVWWVFVSFQICSRYWLFVFVFCASSLADIACQLHASMHVFMHLKDKKYSTSRWYAAVCSIVRYRAFAALQASLCSVPACPQTIGCIGALFLLFLFYFFLFSLIHQISLCCTLISPEDSRGFSLKL